MSTNPLDLIEARAQAATNGPWVARTTGRAGGDHWYVCDDGESIASIHASDGEDEERREPDAVFIAAARTDVEKMAKALRAVEAVHVPETYEYPEDSPDCAGSHAECQYCEGDHPWPCPTITAIRAALNG